MLCSVSHECVIPSQARQMRVDNFLEDLLYASSTETFMEGLGFGPNCRQLLEGALIRGV